MSASGERAAALGRVALTGASGYVGARIARALREAGADVRLVLRAPLARSPDDGAGGGLGAIPTAVVGDFTGEVDWRGALDGVHAVVHAAGLSHVAGAKAPDPERHDRVNHRATARLARAARAAGVARFVFLGSAAVYGERHDGEPLTERASTAPATAYALSKRRAEGALREIEAGGTMRVALLRPPLVHGPHCTGNLATLARLTRSGLPIPFGALHGRRSLVGVDNLAHFVATLLGGETDVSGTWNVADADDVSLAEILDALAVGLGACGARLFPLPPPLLSAAARLLGRGEMFDKLAHPVRIDAAAARRRFDWQPPRDVRDGLIETGASFARRPAIR